jgi:hypothetical protein
MMIQVAHKAAHTLHVLYAPSGDFVDALPALYFSEPEDV